MEKINDKRHLFAKILLIILALLIVATVIVEIIEPYKAVMVLANAVGGALSNKSNDQTETFLQRYGNKHMTGAVLNTFAIAYEQDYEHPGNSILRQDKYPLVKDKLLQNGINWIRIDFCSPMYLANGEISPFYEFYKDNVKRYHDDGFNVMIITPYPSQYQLFGYDLTTDEGLNAVAQDVASIVKDLSPYVGAVQVYNEIGVEHLTAPLDMATATKLATKTVQAIKNDTNAPPVGINCAAMDMYRLTKMLGQETINLCDWMGIDIYLGCFEGLAKDIHLTTTLLNAYWNITKKPIIVTEFGYISDGQAKSKTEKQAILQQYGYDNEKQAKQDIQQFVSKLPVYFQETLAKLDVNSDKQLANRLFNTEVANHLYKQLTPNFRLWGYPHTLQGQADCLADMISQFQQLDYVMGSFVYNVGDSEYCYYCGQKDCPIETRWGILDANGNEKPSFYSVVQQYAQWDD